MLSAVRQTTGSGSPAGQWSGSYQAYGMASSSGGSTANHYQWGAGSGYRSDGFGPTGGAALQKVGARYYDPEFGCFLTRDTDLTQKPYAYCYSDPINFSDPSGNGPLAVVGAIFGAVILAAVVVVAVPVIAVAIGGVATTAGVVFVASAIGGLVAGAVGGGIGAGVGSAFEGNNRRQIILDTEDGAKFGAGVGLAIGIRGGLEYRGPPGGLGPGGGSGEGVWPPAPTIDPPPGWKPY